MPACVLWINAQLHTGSADVGYMMATIERWRGGWICRVYERVDGVTRPLLAVAGSAAHVDMMLLLLLGVSLEHFAQLIHKGGVLGGDDHRPEPRQRVVHPDAEPPSRRQKR